MTHWTSKIEAMKANAITMEMAVKELSTLFDKYEWFYDVQMEQNAICVYVNYIDAEVQKLVPEVMYGYQVKIGYKAYLTCELDYGKRSELLNQLEAHTMNDFE